MTREYIDSLRGPHELCVTAMVAAMVSIAVQFGGQFALVTKHTGGQRSAAVGTSLTEAKSAPNRTGAAHVGAWRKRAPRTRLY